MKWVLLPESGDAPQWHAVRVRATDDESGQTVCGKPYIDVLDETQHGRWPIPTAPDAKCKACVEATGVSANLGGRSTMNG